MAIVACSSLGHLSLGTQVENSRKSLVTFGYENVLDSKEPDPKDEFENKANIGILVAFGALLLVVLVAPVRQTLLGYVKQWFELLP